MILLNLIGAGRLSTVSRTRVTRSELASTHRNRSAGSNSRHIVEEIIMSTKSSQCRHIPKYHTLAVVGIWFLVAFQPAGSFAEGVMTNITTKTPEGVPLNAIIGVRLHDNLLNLPAGYLDPWPTKKAFSTFEAKTLDIKELHFAFWMPSLRFLEVNPFFLTGPRPQEQGREQPDSNTYVVTVRQFQHIYDDLRYISPEQKFKNVTSVPGFSSFSFFEEKFGLVRFRRPEGVYSDHDPFVYYTDRNYRNEGKSAIQVFARCNNPRVATGTLILDDQ